MPIDNFAYLGDGIVLESLALESRSGNSRDKFTNHLKNFAYSYQFQR